MANDIDLDNLKGRLKEIYDESVKKNREMSQWICANGDVTLGEEKCIGQEHECTAPSCKIGKEVALIHTHPMNAPTPSTHDVVNLFFRHVLDGIDHTCIAGFIGTVCYGMRDDTREAKELISVTSTAKDITTGMLLRAFAQVDEDASKFVKVSGITTWDDDPISKDILIKVVNKSLKRKREGLDDIIKRLNEAE